MKTTIAPVLFFMKPFFCFFLFLFSITSVAQEKTLIDNYWVEHFTKEHGLSDDTFIDILQDENGFIWMTSNYNLIRYDGYNFKHYSFRDSFPHKSARFVPGLIEGPKGKLWMFVQRLGVVSFDKRTNKFQSYGWKEGEDDIFTGKYLTAMLRDKNNNIWISTLEGLNRLEIINDDSIKVEHYYTNALANTPSKNIDSLFAQSSERFSIIEVKINQNLSKPFQLHHPREVLIKDLILLV